MKKISLILVVLTASLSPLLVGCGSVKEYLITSGSENLQSLTKVTDNSGQTVSSIGVSPTIFLAVWEGRSKNIYKKENPTSAAMAQITSGDINCSDPDYNPATNRLAFNYRTRYNDYNWTKADIYTLGFNNVNALSPVTQSATIEEFSPSFTPDGQIICYQCNNGSKGELWTKDLKNNETTLIGSGMMPKISPDGKKIVFSRYKTSAYDSPASIWVMNIDGTDVTELVSNPNQRMFSPSWSPDGKKIVFHAKSKKGNNYTTSDIFTVNSDGSGLTQLTTNDSDDMNPVWSADNYIYFVSDRGAKKGNYQAWRFRAN